MTVLETAEQAQIAVANALATVRSSRHAHVELTVAKLRIDETVAALRSQSE